jgi:NCAIR mutase (PurE)-related protein
VNGPSRPFDDIRRALASADEAADGQPAGTRLDPRRGRRSGVPEIVYAEPKPTEEVIASLRRLASLTGRALASRCRPETIDRIREALGAEFAVTAEVRARLVIVAMPGAVPPETGGRVGVIAAGSSDAPAAAEAALVAAEMGCAVTRIDDVGVAGLHRLVRPLEGLVAAGVDAIVVAAGMDGALPSVVSGLVGVPVIGLPTSVGYGFGGDGVGALTTMLQTCAPGLTVVNIDNGVGAGATAALIANRVAAARGGAR